jgi:hypothetical protein
VTLGWEGSRLTMVGLVQMQVSWSWSRAALDLRMVMSTIQGLGRKDWQMDM